MPLCMRLGTRKLRGALGGGFYEHGGLDFYKSVFVEIVPCDFGDAVAHENVFLKVGTAQVEIAVFKAKFFLDVGVFDNFKGRGLRKTEHLKLADGNFNLSGGNVFVHRRTAADNAGGGKNIFGSDLKSLVENFLVGGVVKGKLANAAAVAEIDKKSADRGLSDAEPSRIP